MRDSLDSSSGGCRGTEGSFGASGGEAGVVCGKDTGWELGAGFLPFTSCITRAWLFIMYYQLRGRVKNMILGYSLLAEHLPGMYEVPSLIPGISGRKDK